MKPLSIITTLALSVHAKAACSTISPVTLTFYGWPDNDPPSAEIAYDCGRGYKAGGNGTYDNPLTAASAPGEFEKCEIVYLPYIQRYVRVEDTCATCTTNWNKKQHHIDIWIESTVSDDGARVMDCENMLTPKHGVRVVRDPEKFRVVDDPLYFGGRCYTELASYSSTESCVASGSGDANKNKNEHEHEHEHEDDNDDNEEPSSAMSIHELVRNSHLGLLVLAAASFFL